MPTKAELMEISNETLVLWAQLVRNEADRRQLNIEAIPVHPGNVEGGKPIPVVVRLLRRLPTLPPADIAKLDQLVESWVRDRK